MHIVWYLAELIPQRIDQRTDIIALIAGWDYDDYFHTELLTADICCILTFHERLIPASIGDFRPE